MVWLQQFKHTEAEYLNPSVFVHSPILIKCKQYTIIHPRPFKFFNKMMEHSDFAERMKNSWGDGVDNITMKQVRGKLNNVKQQSKDINNYIDSYKQKLQVLDNPRQNSN